MTQKHIAEQEKSQKHTWKPVQDENGVWIVPEARKPVLLQTEADVKLESDPICTSAGCNYRKNRGKTAYPMDYFVPNFGRDSNINTSFGSLDWAEKNVGHEWKLDWAAIKAKKPELNYPVPNFGVDEDIKMTQGNIADSEKKLKHTWKPVEDENGVWVVPEANKPVLLQTDSDVKVNSDPICTSAGCNYRKNRGKTPYPMDYFVPNFGRDKDINTSFSSLDWAEKNTGHNWKIDWDAIKAKKPAKDYPVPNFGIDEDVKMTQSHVAEQEKKLKHEWKPVQDENGVWGVPEANKNSSYSYKSLVQTGSQVDIGSDPVCSSAGCNYRKDKGKTPYPMDYFVPHFGRDHDINSTWASLDWAEDDENHKFNPLSKKAAKKLEHDKDYPVPDFGLDEDIVETQDNIKDQEKLKKHKWEPKKDSNGVYVVPTPNDNDSYSYSSLVQTDAQVNTDKKVKHRHHNSGKSDPICSSAGYPCQQNRAPKSAYPVDYKVPNFGVDQDIVHTQKHIKDAEKKLGHNWKPVQDVNGIWEVPTAHKPSLAQIGSDPVCHSAGCPKTKWFKKDKDNEVVYYDDVVKKFGYDEDIVDSVGNEMMVSKAMGVPFNMPLYAQLESESDPVCHSAGCTQYNWMESLRKKQGDPPVEYKTNQALEGDIISTWDNLDVAEKIKNHEWVFNHDVYNLKDKADDSVKYDDSAKLDDDIINTQGHLSAAEKKLGDWDIFKDKKQK